MATIAAMAFAAFMAWLLNQEKDFPVAWRFWGTVGIAAALLLPMPVLQQLVGIVSNRFGAK